MLLSSLGAFPAAERGTVPKHSGSNTGLGEAGDHERLVDLVVSRTVMISRWALAALAPVSWRGKPRLTPCG